MNDAEVTVRGNKREARRAFTGLSRLHEADEGKLAASASVTVSELIASWLDLVETDLASTTIDGYRNLVRWYIEPGLGHVRVGRLTAPQLDTFYKALQREKGLSSSTVARRDEWIAAGVFEALAAFDRIVGLDLGEVSLDGSLHKAPCGGEGTGPNPTDRAKFGCKWSVAVERHGIPIGCSIDGANRNDVRMLAPHSTLSPRADCS